MLKKILHLIIFSLIPLLGFPQGVCAEMESSGHQNRLIHEKSPYLLQHAHNPVDWYAWGEEAFEKAKKEDKPIFLSIGYSTCHWCHVMEKESFENEEIAKVMNEYFVSIKVDREERPDVDQVYMQAVMAMTGSGGWPMSVFLTPELKPFYGGTYFPPEDKWGKPGFKTVLTVLADKWKEDREALLKSSEDMTQFLKTQAAQKSDAQVELNEEVLFKGYQQYHAQYDERLGGFGQAPKFPRSHIISFLLRYWKRSGETLALEMSEKTLVAMARGGMYDHIGDGFHRYSTDGKWHIPHFEKMLYDQALLSKTYLESYQATGRDLYAYIARQILEYVHRDLKSPEGGFYSAEDADSAEDASKPNEKTEGAFYVWEEKELKELLGEEKAAIINYVYGVLPNGNAEVDPHGEFKNKNTLYLAHTVQETAEKFSQTEEQIISLLDETKKVLFEARSKRPKPYLDDKILTDWNGLMITSFASAARILQEPRYLEAAQAAADFIINNMKTPEGRLLHRYRDGEARVEGFIEDYAFFANALVDLYEASFEVKYLEEAVFLTQEMIRLFWDEAAGGFFFIGRDAEKLIARMKEIYDGAVPSGNSVAALVLLRVSRITMDKTLGEKAEQLFKIFSKQISEMPSGYPQMLIALDFLLGPSQEIVLAGEKNALEAMTKEIFIPFIPNKVVLFHSDNEEEAKKIESLASFIKPQVAISEKTTVYVCENYTCNLPTTDPLELRKLLK